MNPCVFDKINLKLAPRHLSGGSKAQILYFFIKDMYLFEESPPFIEYRAVVALPIRASPSHRSICFGVAGREIDRSSRTESWMSYRSISKIGTC